MSERLVPDLLAEQARTNPDSIALIDADSGERWRYDELSESVGVVAGRLRGRGIEAGDRVGLLLDSRVPVVHLVHACFRVGATVVPLNTRLDTGTLSEQVGHVELASLVCESETADRARPLADDRDLPVVSVDETPAVETLSEGDSLRGEPAKSRFDDPASVLFTSGTTATPKAVVLTPKNLLSSAVASAFRLGVLPDDRWFSPLSTYHMGGLAPIVRCALSGTTLVVSEGFDADRTGRQIEECEATGISLVPTMLGRLLDAGFGYGGLRFVLLGGAPTPPELIARCEREGIPVCPSWGMTETASQIATALPDEAFSQPESVGRPLLGTAVRAVADGEVQPPGEVGELVVRGPTVTPGYHATPELTEEAFGAHGFRTGDVGSVGEDARIRVLGRVDDAITTGGETVHPSRIAAALGEHPDVRDAAVVGLPDPEWGERVAALVEADAGREPDEAELREFCAERLAGYEVPKTIRVGDGLPRTASGTVDRVALRRLLGSGSPG
ncbi:class I adenylate-forming enzyme family protein [Natronorarus salvus]|uniref:class I adenylate-forming enzyme family protein n=1 Tax=Natronorarus salvus TaxID=3117733 RepID=UPI002F260AFC